MAGDPPVDRAEAHRLADGKAGESLGDAGADDDLAGAGRKQPPFGKPGALAQARACHVHAPQRQGLVGTVACPYIDGNDGLARQSPPARTVAGDPRVAAHGGKAADSLGRHVRAGLLVGAAAEDDGDIGRTGPGKRGFEATRHRQEACKHRHHERHRQHHRQRDP